MTTNNNPIRSSLNDTDYNTLQNLSAYRGVPMRFTARYILHDYLNRPHIREQFNLPHSKKHQPKSDYTSFNYIPRTKSQISLPEHIHMKSNILCNRLDMTFNELICTLINEHFDRVIPPHDNPLDGTTTIT